MIKDIKTGRVLPKDIIGQKFGNLLAISFSHKGKWKNHFWNFKCDCGKNHIAGKTNVMNGKIISCGCLKGYVKPEIRQRMNNNRVSTRIKKECLICKKEIFVQKYLKDLKKFCSRNCAAKFTLKKVWIGRKHRTESLAKMSQSHLKNPSRYWLGKKRGNLSGENNWRWMTDRTQLKIAYNSEERRSSRYKDWRRQVCNRDEWRCKINRNDCEGRLEVHHILSFTDYPELRYEINNGITLCHAHHPRKRALEKEMAPVFQELLKG